jgi:hypothetical protein
MRYLFLLIAFYIPSVAFAQFDPSDVFNDTVHPAMTFRSNSFGGWQYRGTLGNHRIGLSIGNGDAQHFSAFYFYGKYLKDIPLKGEVTGPRDIVLHEFDSLGKPVADIHLHFAERDTAFPLMKTKLSSGILTGEWTSAKGANYPIRLEEWDNSGGEHRWYNSPDAKLSDAEIESNIQSFYFSILRGDSVSASKYVNYPLWVNTVRGHYTIKTPEQFESKYHALFPRKFVKEIAQDLPHYLRWMDNETHGQGVMLNGGDLWFNWNGKLSSTISPLS